MDSAAARFDQRLTAIEGEVRRIADSLSLLVRIDERVVTLFNGHDELKQRVSALESRSGKDHWTVSAFTKFGWIIASALLAFGFSAAKDRMSAPAVTVGKSQDVTASVPRTEGR